MVRYGLLQVSKPFLEELLCLTKLERCATKRITDLPDDVAIDDITFDSTRNSLILLLKGSGAPLQKVPEGAKIPYINIEFKPE